MQVKFNKCSNREILLAGRKGHKACSIFLEEIQKRQATNKRSTS